MSNDTTARVEYTWKGVPTDADTTEDYRFTMGGSTVLIHAELESRSDGSMALSLLSTGPEDRQALSHIVNLLQSIVAQEAMEYAAEKGREAPAASDG